MYRPGRPNEVKIPMRERLARLLWAHQRVAAAGMEPNDDVVQVAETLHKPYWWHDTQVRQYWRDKAMGIINEFLPSRRDPGWGHPMFQPPQGLPPQTSLPQLTIAQPQVLAPQRPRHRYAHPQAQHARATRPQSHQPNSHRPQVQLQDHRPWIQRAQAGQARVTIGGIGETNPVSPLATSSFQTVVAEEEIAQESQHTDNVHGPIAQVAVAGDRGNDSERRDSAIPSTDNDAESGKKQEAEAEKDAENAKNIAYGLISATEDNIEMSAAADDEAPPQAIRAVTSAVQAGQGAATAAVAPVAAVTPIAPVASIAAVPQNAPASPVAQNVPAAENAQGSQQAQQAPGGPVDLIAAAWLRRNNAASWALRHAGLPTRTFPIGYWEDHPPPQ